MNTPVRSNTTTSIPAPQRLPSLWERTLSENIEPRALFEDSLSESIDFEEQSSNNAIVEIHNSYPLVISMLIAGIDVSEVHEIVQDSSLVESLLKSPLVQIVDTEIYFRRSVNKHLKRLQVLQMSDIG